jgi:hypothetical protein
MRVLWTLYLSFAYLVYAIVLFMVVGFKNMGSLEWTGMAGAPVLIYAIRTGVTAIFAFRIDTLTARLREQQKEREKTIQKLKEATKYDTTLELLEKYGGSDGKSKKANQGTAEEEADSVLAQGKQSGRQGAGKVAQRTNMPPPPTANIARQGPRPSTQAQRPVGPAGALGHPRHQLPQSVPPQIDPVLDTSAEFAPNAFGPVGEPPTTHYAPVQHGPGETHWYDRIMDLLLGEDETSAKNRIVLVCARCRLVNGQAPPGTKTLAELGQWKCMACGTMNGEVDEGKRIVDEVLQKELARSVGEELDARSEEGSDLVTVDKDEEDGSLPPLAPRKKGNKKSAK